MKNKNKLTTIHFNTELITSEITGTIFFYLSVIIAGQILTNNKTLTLIGVGGSTITSILIWFNIRIRHGKERGDHNKKKLVGDVLYITPAIFIASILFYHPATVGVSYLLLEQKYDLYFSTIIARSTAFILLLGTLNIYRYSIKKITGREL